MPERQRRLCLTLRRAPGQSATDWKLDQRELDSEPRPTLNRQARLAALLRRQAASVCDDVTACPPAALPHQVRRLRDLLDLVIFLMSSEGFLEADECQRSDRQLAHPSTVADWAAVMDIVRVTHRTPAYVTTTAVELERIHHKLDLLAALVGGVPGATEAWESEVAS